MACGVHIMRQQFSKGEHVTYFIIILALIFIGIAVCGFMLSMMGKDRRLPRPREIKPGMRPPADPWDVDKLPRGKREL